MIIKFIRLGIKQLAVALRQVATVQIIALYRNRSKASNSLTLDALLCTQIQSKVNIAILSCTPTDYVHLSVNTLIHPGQDIVVSGINTRHNLGDNMIYSGTVVSSIEGRHLSYLALVVLLNSNSNFSIAAVETYCLLSALTSSPLRTGKILNVNVSDLSLSLMKGCKLIRCGSRHSASEIICQKDPHNRGMLWIWTPANSFDEKLDTDFNVVNYGYVLLMSLQVDLTAIAVRSVLSYWLSYTKRLALW